MGTRPVAEGGIEAIIRDQPNRVKCSQNVSLVNGLS